MPYNPSINDNSGQILAEAQMQANKIRALEQQQMWESIGNAASSISEGAAKAYEKANENKMTSEYLDAVAGQLKDTNRPGTTTTYFTPEEFEKFSKSSLGAKQGMIAPKQAMYDQDLKNSYQQLQMQSYLDRLGVQATNQAALRLPPPNQQPYIGGNAAQQNNNPAGGNAASQNNNPAGGINYNFVK